MAENFNIKELTRNGKVLSGYDAGKRESYDSVREFEQKNELPFPVVDANGQIEDWDFVRSAYDSYVYMSHRDMLEPYKAKFEGLTEDAERQCLAQVYYAKANGLDESHVDTMINVANEKTKNNEWAAEYMRNMRNAFQDGYSKSDMEMLSTRDASTQDTIMGLLGRNDENYSPKQRRILMQSSSYKTAYAVAEVFSNARFEGYSSKYDDQAQALAEVSAKFTQYNNDQWNAVKESGSGVRVKHIDGEDQLASLITGTHGSEPLTADELRKVGDGYLAKGNTLTFEELEDVVDATVGPKSKSYAKQLDLIRYASMSDYTVRGKSFGAMYQARYDALESSYDEYTVYIDDYRQQCEAEAKNAAIRDEQKDLKEMMTELSDGESVRFCTMYQMLHPDMEYFEVTQVYRDTFENDSIPESDLLDAKMKANYGMYTVLSKDEANEAKLRHVGCNVYDEFNTANGMFDPHYGYDKSSALYREDIVEQQQVVNDLRSDIAKICGGGGTCVGVNMMQFIEGSASKTVLSDDVKNSINRYLPNDVIDYMYKYDAKYFAENCSGSVLKCVSDDTKYKKTHVSGVWLKPDGTTQDVNFNGRFGNHKFSRVELTNLLAGNDVTIPDFKTKSGEVKSITGHLANLSYDGHDYVGFELGRAKSAVKSVDKKLDRVKQAEALSLNVAGYDDTDYQKN